MLRKSDKKADRLRGEAAAMRVDMATNAARGCRLRHRLGEARLSPSTRGTSPPPSIQNASWRIFPAPFRPMLMPVARLRPFYMVSRAA